MDDLAKFAEKNKQREWDMKMTNWLKHCLLSNLENHTDAHNSISLIQKQLHCIHYLVNNVYCGSVQYTYTYNDCDLFVIWNEMEDPQVLKYCN